MKTSWLLLLIGLLGACASPTENTQNTKTENKPPALPTRPTAEAGKTRIAYPKADSVGKAFYLTQYYSPAELASIKQKELTAWQKDLEAKYNQKFQVRHFGKYFNIAYRCTDAEASQLEYVAKIFFQEVYPRFFRYEPEYAFKIVYFAHKPEFTAHTESEAYGFYQPRTKTLFTYAHSGEGTLWHELIHAFVDANIEHNIQQWFSEGFASFYEMGGIANNQFVEGYTNWRLPLLQKMLKRESYLPLPTFAEQQEMSEDNAYAKARFLFCYLWLYDKMDEFVKIYLYELSAQSGGKHLGKKAIAEIERLVGKDINEIETEYKALATQFVPSQKLQKFPKK